MHRHCDKYEILQMSVEHAFCIYVFLRILHLHKHIKSSSLSTLIINNLNTKPKDISN